MSNMYLLVNDPGRRGIWFTCCTGPTIKSSHVLLKTTLRSAPILISTWSLTTSHNCSMSPLTFDLSRSDYPQVKPCRCRWAGPPRPYRHACLIKHFAKPFLNALVTPARSFLLPFLFNDALRPFTDSSVHVSPYTIEYK